MALRRVLPRLKRLAGMGTTRRNPPLEWHLGHEDLDEVVHGLVAQHGQRAVLDAVFAARRKRR